VKLAAGGALRFEPGSTLISNCWCWQAASKKGVVLSFDHQWQQQAIGVVSSVGGATG